MHFQNVHQESRLLESRIREKLKELSSLLQNLSPSDRSVDDSQTLFNSLSAEIQHSLEELHSRTTILQSLSSTNVAQYQMATRISDNYELLQREFTAVRSNILRQRQKLQLFSGMSQDDLLHIDDNTRTRASIANSHSIADELMEQVDVARSSLLEQGSTLTGASGKLAVLVSKFPSLDSIMRMTRIRRVRNTIVMAFILALLFFLVYIVKK
ncbi:hypothetical protein GEMRC1_007939 [Eukaryota sp. GEM-RC1]